MRRLVPDGLLLLLFSVLSLVIMPVVHVTHSGSSNISRALDTKPLHGKVTPPLPLGVKLLTITRDLVKRHRKGVAVREEVPGQGAHPHNATRGHPLLASLVNSFVLCSVSAKKGFLVCCCFLCARFGWSQVIIGHVHIWLCHVRQEQYATAV